MNRTSSHFHMTRMTRLLYLLAASILLMALLANLTALAGGTLDQSFGSGGRVVTSLSGQVTPSTIIVQPDGKLLAVGTIYHQATATDIALARYHSDGSLDNTFGVGGKVVTIISPNYDNAGGAALQADGKIVVVGSKSVSSGATDLLVVRYNADGSLDTGFGNGGIVTTNQAPQDQLIAVAIQSDGKIVAAGRTDSPTIARYNTDGSLENLFITDFFDLGVSNSTYRAMAILPNGQILASGSGFVGEGFLARYNADGNLDSGFGTSSGRILTTNNLPQDIALLPDGKFLVSGSRVQRFLNNGTIDPSFNQTNITGSKLAVLPNGQISVIGDGLKLLRSDGGKISRLNLSQEPVHDIATQADGKIVILGTTPSTGSGMGNGFILHRYLTITSLSSHHADFDSDQKTDFGVFRPSDGSWYIKRNNLYGFDRYAGYQAGDYVAPGDYNGDGRSDPMVWRAAQSAGAQGYFCKDLNISPNCRPWGSCGDIPVGGDYDSDGITDLAVFRGGVWHILQSSSNSYLSISFGLPEDKPVMGDYDHDGKYDAAVFRPSNGTWYVLLSSDNTVLAQPFGLSTDQLVPGDYDGDGKTDFAVFRNGIWYMQQSAAGFRTFQFGIAEDRPVPGDYDGDGRTDVAVFRDGTWFLLQSADGFKVEYFGTAGDIPLSPGYVAQ